MEIPSLEPRFLQPNGWQWGEFVRAGRRIRFGWVMPEKPKAVMVFLPGLSEFCEKHFETAHWALAQGYGFFIIDWYGQGKSGRYFPDHPHKRHAGNFQNYVDDLKEWIERHILPVAQDPGLRRDDGGALPLFMLALSMGGNIGLHYLVQNPDTFKSATFLCPMWGIKTMRHIPLATQISRFIDRFAGDAYVPGGGDWKEIMHPSAELSFLSKDPLRNPIHNAWCIADPDLQVGGVTFGWVFEAHQSCEKLKELNLESIHTPILVACAHHEMLVDNKTTREICVRLPDVKLFMLHDSWHEPLMERDNIRNAFFDKFAPFVQESLKEAP